MTLSLRHRSVSIVSACACLVFLASALPASAEPTAVSTATVTVEGGGLSISAPGDAGNLGTQSNGVGPLTISGPLGQVQVTDSRGAPAGSGWTATAISTAFTQTAGPSIGADAVGYSAGPITKVGTATYTANDPANLTGVSPVVTATAITGDNTATWNPTIHVAVAADMPAGVYIGTITHSVS
ncbi:MAG: Nucleoporin 62kDa-like protein [Aeromicrobium sp.]|nr:Nucleoporin 62kDa-like protein [Aeromicrobium sp.]